MENRFTGWTDVDLSDKGREEAREAGRLLATRATTSTSPTPRAQARHPHALDRPRRAGPDVAPGRPDWQLNERHYGALQGLNKAETAAKFGEEQVKVWRRSYDDAAARARRPRTSASRAATAATRASTAPSCRSPSPQGHGRPRRAVLGRDDRARDVKAGRRVLVAAHGNSLRALVKYLDGISDDEIVGVNIPTGVPLVYELDDGAARARAPLSRGSRRCGRRGIGRRPGTVWPA